MLQMDDRDVYEFLEKRDPGMLGVLGTTATDGAPRVVPLWFRYDGEVVHVWTGKARHWVRHITRDSRFAFSVQEAAPPYAGVIMQGRAEVTSGDSEEVSQEIRRITRRYIPEGDVEAYIASWPQLRTIVTLRPFHVKAWSKGY